MLRVARTATVALALIAVELGLAVQAGADVLPQQSPAANSTSASPAPTPCPTDLTGVLCGATGGSTPTPSPAPTPTPTPKPASSSSSGTAPGGGAGSASQPPSAAAGSTGGQPGAPGKTAGPTPSPAAVAQVAASFRNAPFLGQLLDILKHPTAAQRPDLRHFRPAGGGTLGGPGAGPGPGPGGMAMSLVVGPAASRGSMGAAMAVALLGMLLAMGIAVLAGYPQARLALRRLAWRAWRLHPSLHPVFVAWHNLAVRVRTGMHGLRRRLGVPRLAMRTHSHRSLALASATATLPALLTAAVLASAATTAAGAAGLASASPAPQSAYIRSEMALVDDAQQASSQVATASWVRLVGIEKGLAAQQDELAAQEAQINRLVLNLGGHDPENEDSVAVGPDSTVQQRNSLASLVAAHAATQAAYQQSLQAEYDLYRAAAQDPAQRAQLTAAVATAPPQAKDAVSYNLSLIQTQLSQEAAIAQAEARLQAIGSLTDVQLAAMRRHQPFIAPLVAPVTQPFGPTDFSLEPPLSFNGTFYPHFHTGLDLGAPLDTPVHAAADGVVLLAAASVDSSGKLVGYGNYVAIAHPDGFVTLYGHLDSIAVQAGQVVRQGDIIGQEGSTGWSTGPHVHFEIRHDGQFLDPAPYLAGQLPS